MPWNSLVEKSDKIFKIWVWLINRVFYNWNMAEKFIIFCNKKSRCATSNREFTVVYFNPSETLISSSLACHRRHPARDARESAPSAQEPAALRERQPTRPKSVQDKDGAHSRLAQVSQTESSWESEAKRTFHAWTVRVMYDTWFDNRNSYFNLMELQSRFQIKKVVTVLWTVKRHFWAKSCDSVFNLFTFLVLSL